MRTGSTARSSTSWSRWEDSAIDGSRSRAYALTGAASIAIGAAAAGVALSLVRFESWIPVRLRAVPRPDPVPPADWREAWPVGRTPAEIQADGLDPLIWLLLALAAAAVAVAAANLLILAASRASDRRRELAVRAALGATGSRLAASGVRESAGIGLLGLGLGLPLALAGWQILVLSWPAGLEPAPDAGVRLAAVVLAGGALAALLAAGASLPALVAGRRANLREPLQAGGHATADVRTRSARDALAVVQVAALLGLLAAGGILVRHASPEGGAERPGYDPDGLHLFRLDLRSAAGSDTIARLAAAEAVLREVAGLPEIHAESIASAGTLLGLGTEARVHVECRCVVGNFFLPFVGVVARQHAVGPGFFRASGIPILRGREFGPEDRPGGARVAVVNRTFADHHFGDGDPIGRMVQPGALREEWFTVVGIVEDVHPRGPGAGAAPTPALYVPAYQHTPAVMELIARRPGRDPADPLVAAARADGAAATAGDSTLTAGDSTLVAGIAVGPGRSAAEELSRYASPLPWFGRLYSGMAAVATLLALYGLGSVMANQVVRRRREIGIRLALGASAARVRLLVTLDAGRLVRAGVVLGFLLALGLARGVQLLFPGVRMLDAPLLAGIAAILAVTALAASWVPGVRASRLEPLAALRSDD